MTDNIEIQLPRDQPDDVFAEHHARRRRHHSRHWYRDASAVFAQAALFVALISLTLLLWWFVTSH